MVTGWQAGKQGRALGPRGGARGGLAWSSRPGSGRRVGSEGLGGLQGEPRLWALGGESLAWLAGWRHRIARHRLLAGGSAINSSPAGPARPGPASCRVLSWLPTDPWASRVCVRANKGRAVRVRARVLPKVAFFLSLRFSPSNRCSCGAGSQRSPRLGAPGGWGRSQSRSRSRWWRGARTAPG